MKKREDCKLAKPEWVNESNKDDEFIYAQATDHEGKGYLDQYLNPNFVKEDKPKEVKAEKNSVTKENRGRPKKNKMGALFK